MDGALGLIDPPALREVLRAQLAEEPVTPEALGPRFNRGTGGGTVEFAVRTRAGMRKAAPLGRPGEFGLEAW